jgi:hypothetical protein
VIAETSSAQRFAALARQRQYEIKRALSFGLLERSIGRVVDRPLLREIARIQRVLSAPRPPSPSRRAKS